MADRLTRIVPPGFTVRAEGSSVDVYGSGTDRHASAIAVIMDDGGEGSLLERMDTAAAAILSGVQDGVAEILTRPWPQTATGQLALPHTRRVAGRVEMWFGDEHAPVLRLPPVGPAELASAAGSGGDASRPAT